MTVTFGLAAGYSLTPTITGYTGGAMTYSVNGDTKGVLTGAVTGLKPGDISCNRGRQRIPGGQAEGHGHNSRLVGNKCFSGQLIIVRSCCRQGVAHSVESPSHAVDLVGCFRSRREADSLSSDRSTVCRVSSANSHIAIGALGITGPDYVRERGSGLRA